MGEMRKKKSLFRAHGAEFSDDHQVRLLQGAEELFPALVAAMDAALSDIQFETYIFDFTGAGADVGEALMRAAARGVRTQLVVDGVGTGPLPVAWAERFRAAGVQYRVYSPLGPLGLLLPHRWRRLHRKLCVWTAVCCSAAASMCSMTFTTPTMVPWRRHGLTSRW
jgi:cardiolipin synthase